MTITYNKQEYTVAGQNSPHSQSSPNRLAPQTALVPARAREGKRPGIWVKYILLSLAALLLSGCETIDLKRITYDFLRQEDCRRNDVAVYEFCSRTFVFEYDEYEQLRQEYIRTEQSKMLEDQAAREQYHHLYHEGI